MNRYSFRPHRQPPSLVCTTSEPAIELRAFMFSDLPQVLAIEAASFARPASEMSFRMALEHDMIGTVAECYGRVDGYSFHEIDDSTGTVYLRNIAVAPAMRRRGIGTRLLGRLARLLVPGRRERLDAHVLLELLPDAGVILGGFGFRAVPWWAGKYLRTTRAGDEVLLLRYSPKPFDTGCEVER